MIAATHTPAARIRGLALAAARLGSAALLVLSLSVGAAEPSLDKAAAGLRERFVALRSGAEPNPFRMPLYLQASVTDDRVQGDVHALVDRPYAQVRPVLEQIEHWCDILILHQNVKYCRRSVAQAGKALIVGVAPKHEQSLDGVSWMRLDFDTAGPGAAYARIALDAPTGPFGTGDYRLRLEAVPFEGRTLLHLSYGYSYGVAASVAMEAYLATLGRNKVGFSAVGRQADGQPVYVDGLRGVIERNAMRYYFAIDAYLGALHLPPPERMQQSLRTWFDATERFPRQLRELERDEYLDMKRREIARQQEAATGR